MWSWTGLAFRENFHWCNMFSSWSMHLGSMRSWDSDWMMIWRLQSWFAQCRANWSLGCSFKLQNQQHTAEFVKWSCNTMLRLHDGQSRWSWDLTNRAIQSPIQIQILAMVGQQTWRSTGSMTREKEKEKESPRRKENRRARESRRANSPKEREKETRRAKELVIAPREKEKVRKHVSHVDVQGTMPEIAGRIRDKFDKLETRVANSSNSSSNSHLNRLRVKVEQLVDGLVFPSSRFRTLAKAIKRPLTE